MATGWNSFIIRFRAVGEVTSNYYWRGSLSRTKVLNIEGTVVKAPQKKSKKTKKVEETRFCKKGDNVHLRIDATKSKSRNVIQTRSVHFY